MKFSDEQVRNLASLVATCLYSMLLFMMGSAAMLWSIAAIKILIYIILKWNPLA